MTCGRLPHNAPGSRQAGFPQTRWGAPFQSPPRKEAGLAPGRSEPHGSPAQRQADPVRRGERHGLLACLAARPSAMSLEASAMAAPIPFRGSLPLTYSFWASMRTSTDSASEAARGVAPPISKRVLGRIVEVMVKPESPWWMPLCPMSRYVRQFAIIDP